MNSLNRDKESEILFDGRYVVSCSCGHLHDITHRIEMAKAEERKKCLACRPKLETITRENFDYAKQEWNNALEAWTERIKNLK